VVPGCPGWLHALEVRAYQVGVVERGPLLDRGARPGPGSESQVPKSWDKAHWHRTKQADAFAASPQGGPLRNRPGPSWSRRRTTRPFISIGGFCLQLAGALFGAKARSGRFRGTTCSQAPRSIRLRRACEGACRYSDQRIAARGSKAMEMAFRGLRLVQGYRGHTQVSGLFTSQHHSLRSSHSVHPHPTPDCGNVRELIEAVTREARMRRKATRARGKASPSPPDAKKSPAKPVRFWFDSRSDPKQVAEEVSKLPSLYPPSKKG
jgi:hypothetical protein